MVIIGLYILLWGKSKERFESVTIQDQLDENVEARGRDFKDLNSTTNSISNQN